jgi:cytochrome c oxidase assembly factor CtaG/putative copper export protein
VHLLAEVHTFSSNAVVTSVLAITKALYFISALTAFGLIFATAFFIREERGVLTAEGIRVKKLAHLATFVTLVTIVGGTFAELANLLGGTLLDAFDGITLRSFLSQTAVGRDFLIQAICTLAVLASLQWARKIGGIYWAALFSILGLITPIFHSHASSAGNHGMAIGSLLFHVLFISIWVGGVIGLVVISPADRAASISRFSSIALWAAIIVAISGVVNAWTRLNFLAGWATLYGLLIGIKILLMVILIGFGAAHRRNLIKPDGSVKTFALLINEALVMVITVAIGAWLSTTQPPVSIAAANAVPDPVVNLTGIAMPPQPTLWRVLSGYVPDGTFLGILLLATALYIRGVVVLTRRGDKWPVGRTVAFALAVSFADFATSGGLGVYAHFAFSYHMIAHMVLGMVAPIGFVLSAPITLALRTLPAGRSESERGVRGSLIAIIHSRYSTIITNPVSALAIFDGSLFGLYLTPAFGSLMRSHSGHLFMDLHFLLAGYLFFYVIVGIDPNPRKIPHIVRIIVLFAAMSIHAFFSITLLSTSSLLDGGYFALLHRPWNVNLLSDQHTGGAVGWAMGEIPILLALIATFLQWVRDDKRESKRIDRAADRAAAMGEDDDLARYNKYLRELNSREPHD